MRGNATHETESFGRVAARSEFRTAVPWAADPSRTVSLAGRTVEMVDFTSVTNRFDYDALGQRISKIDGLGNVTIFAYTPSGILLSTTDPAGFTTVYTYDAAGRRIAVTDALGNTIHTEYDAAGRVVAESGATYPVRKGYDAYGRWTSLKTTRDGSTWDETQWTYDEATGVQTAKTYADGSVVRHGYDEEGRPTRTTWARGAWFENHYDEWGQIVAVMHDDPTIDAAMSYDDFGRLVVSSNNAAAYRYTYDDRGLVTNEFAVIGGITNTIVRDFDDYGRSSRLRIADSDYDQTYVYDDKGRLSVIGIPGSTVTYAYTPDSLDAGYSVLTSSNAVLTRAITRDSLRRGLITSVSNLVNGVDSGSSFDYTYDALGRPTTRNLDEFGYNERGEVDWARYGTNTLADIYDYDFIGNFTSNRLRGSWSQFTANELNEYVGITDDNPRWLSYDADGNLLTNGVWTYSFDSENRITRIADNGMSVLYLYDSSSRLVGAMTSDSTVYHFHDAWNRIRTVEASGVIPALIDNWWGKGISSSINKGGGAGGLFAVHRADGTYYPDYDNNGNIIGYKGRLGNLMAAYSYDVFGMEQTMTGPLQKTFPYRYSTKPFEHNLSYFGYRFYSGKIGRWLSRDIIEENGGINVFSFCRNRALNMIDVLGLSSGVVVAHNWDIEISGCGKVKMKVTLDMVGDTPRDSGGIIHQNVHIRSRVFRCGTGEKVEEDDVSYHEAFELGSEDVFKSDPNAFSDSDRYENSWGYFRWDAVAQYYPDIDWSRLTVDFPQFTIDVDSPRGNLPGGDRYLAFDPDDGYERGQSGLFRSFVFRWNCCDCKTQTSYSYSAISTKRWNPEQEIP